MKIQSVIHRVLLFVITVSACSIDLSQPSVITPSPQAGTTPASVGPISSASDPGVIPDHTTPSITTTTIPITWADLDLTGRLVYIGSETLDNAVSPGIHVLDLATGEVSTTFRSPENAWVFYLTVSPDAKQLVMSYIPPSQGNTPSNRALYIMPLDGTTPPRLLFPPPTPEDHYVHAEWSPDGKYIYYVHYNSKDPLDAQLNPAYDIFRMSYPEGQAERIVDHGFWPRISSDSSRLVYVSIDPVSGRNELYVANTDGSNAHSIAFSGAWLPEVIDAPIFSPDGQSILFSAPAPSQAYQPNWLEKLMGIQVASAHNIPSDWWSVPVTGGVPSRLTRIQTINLFASLSPDKKYIASLSGEGIFVMDQNGSNLTQLLFDPGISGTVNWIP